MPGLPLVPSLPLPRAIPPDQEFVLACGPLVPARRGSMRGTMMDFPLTLRTILERSGKIFPRVEIVSRKPDKSIVRTSYGEFYRRARRLAAALTKLGLKPGDRVASMMWNHSGHLEAFFGVPCAAGILHTLNLRLHPHEIASIAKHAGDTGGGEPRLPVARALHAKAWGVPCAGSWLGARLVLPGAHVDPASRLELMVDEKQRVACRVPPVWIDVRDALGQRATDWKD